jgi:hypothetical protein
MAMDFMEEVSKEIHWKKIVNKREEKPIIEFCFCDQLKERKR